VGPAFCPSICFREAVSRLHGRVEGLVPAVEAHDDNREEERMKTLEDVQTWRGMKMVDADGDKIGTIGDTFLDRQTGVPHGRR
jgi:hypothetical protein